MARNVLVSKRMASTRMASRRRPAWGEDATGLTEAEVAARANQGMPEGDRLLECCACGTDRG